MDKKKGMFSGFSSVFSFTADQNMKGKGFKLTTVVIGLLILAVCAAISIIMAVAQKPDESSDTDNSVINEELQNAEASEIMDAIIISTDTDFDNARMEGFLELCELNDVKVESKKFDFTSESGSQEFYKYANETYKNPVGLNIAEKDDVLEFTYYLSKNGKVSDELISGLAEGFESYYENSGYENAGVIQSQTELLNMSSWTNVSSADSDGKDMGVVVAEMLVPAIFSLVLFMMTALYGQSITKVVMAEKSSKLMEVLLTSIKPYALIFGKISAMSLIAIVQMFIWIALGVVGFFAGDIIADRIYPEYTNYLFQIIDMIKESGTGFSMGAVIISLLFIVIGFLMYCVWAGFIASVVEKVDDVSTAMSLFQIPIMVGFMISYLGSLLEWKAVIKIAEYVPIVSPFVMPGDLLVGKTSVMEGVISLLLLAVFTFVMVLITGKVYKGKVFNKK